MKISMCKGCGKPITFAKMGETTVSLDLTPAVYLVQEDETGFLTCKRAPHVEKKDREVPTPREFAAVSHFNTCPAANQFGKKKEPAPPTKSFHVRLVPINRSVPGIPFVWHRACLANEGAIVPVFLEKLDGQNVGKARIREDHGGIGAELMIHCLKLDTLPAKVWPRMEMTVLKDAGDPNLFPLPDGSPFQGKVIEDCEVTAVVLDLTGQKDYEHRGALLLREETKL